MSTTDNAPDSTRDGGGSFPKELSYLRDYLTDFDALQNFREILREWYVTSVGDDYNRQDNLDVTLFIGLDRFFAELQKPALLASLNQSNNNSTNSKQ